MAAHGTYAMWWHHRCRCDRCRAYQDARNARRRFLRAQRRRRRAAAARANRVRSIVRAGRIEDYLELRSWGLTRRQAAERLGVTIRTTQRYDAALRQRQEAA